MSEEIGAVGVVGLGTMGAGIAYLFASHGLRVVGVDTSASALESAHAHVEFLGERSVAKGTRTRDQEHEVIGRIDLVTELDGLAGCDPVVEAVTEDAAVKARALRAISDWVAPAAVIATNTSALSVTALAAHVERPSRFLGIHFFNPAPSMRLVEVVAAPATSSMVVAKAAEFLTGLGKEVVVVEDRPGFLVNAVLVPYLNQAIEELDMRLGEPAVVDQAVRLGLGYPTGPYEMLDLIGLDTHLLIAQNAYDQTHRSEFAPPPLLQRLVASGRAAIRTGVGSSPEGQERT